MISAFFLFDLFEFGLFSAGYGFLDGKTEPESNRRVRAFEESTARSGNSDAMSFQSSNLSVLSCHPTHIFCF